MSELTPQEETYLAWLTPPGAGAIATLAVRGPRAWAVVHDLFEPVSGRAASLAEGEAGRFWLGWLGDRAGGERDQVVLAVKRGGPSPWLELHGHGGPQVARMLEESLTARGLRLCPWQELERRTGGDPGRAEALAALARAPTARTAAVLLDQYHGAFGRAATDVRDALQREDLAEAGRLLGELARFAPLGRHLTEPWRVAVLGAPNVGKSSLINALAGYQRSVVSPTPGTTRDLVTTRVAIDGWPVELIDTAGWRDSAEALEKEGIELARSAAARADLCLWVMDVSAPPAWPDQGLPGLRLVLNKTDLPAAWDLGRAPGALHVSAQTGAGLAELCEALSHWLVPETPAAGAAVPFTPALCEMIEEARDLCREGRGPEALALLAQTASGGRQSPDPA